jgi:hypothetical protein
MSYPWTIPNQMIHGGGVRAPVSIPSIDAQGSLSPQQADALADFWVSEHNRLPYVFRRPDLPYRGLLENRVLVGPSVENLAARAFHALRRMLTLGQVRRDFGLERAHARALRKAFNDATKTATVRAMDDLSQRRHLGTVILAASRAWAARGDPPSVSTTPTGS